MIQLDHVTKRYSAGLPALCNANFTIEPGEFVYLTGHTGAGKSTVFRLIAAIERPTSGRVVVNGQDVGRLSWKGLPFLRRNLGLVLQQPFLLADRTVFDNVSMPLIAAGVETRECSKRARAALDKVGLLDRERANPRALSGGEQQRVAIARAVVGRPSIIIADEPTANLDSDYATHISALLRSFHQVGVTVLLATHDETLISQHPARKIVLERGRVLHE